MTQPPAELSSISSALDELGDRIGAMALELSSQGEDLLANELFEVERTLTTGRRKLNRIVLRR